MTDLASLLAAVNDSPECDTTRLVLADWIDEQDSSSLTDWHKAHSEYIRMTCGQTPARVDRKTEQSWIKANWRRFVPRLWNDGFRIDLRWDIPYRTHLQDVVMFRGQSNLTVRFDRGFICAAWVDRSGVAISLPPLTEDCPAARFNIYDWTRPYDGDRVSVAEFVPRAVWASIRGYSEIVTRGLQDLLIFSGPGSLARAQTELSEALRRYGESVNAKRNSAPA